MPAHATARSRGAVSDTIRPIDALGPAWRHFWRRKRDYLRLVSPFIAYTVATGAIFAVFTDYRNVYPIFGHIGVDAVHAVLDGINVLSRIVFIAFMVSFAMHWHRFYAEPAKTPRVRDLFTWDAGRTRYAMFVVGFYLAPLATGTLFIELRQRDLIAFDDPTYPIAFWTMKLLLGLLFCRIVLIFPALAEDPNARFADAWRLGRGMTARLILPVLVPIMAAGFLGSLALAVFWSPMHLVHPTILDALHIVGRAFQETIALAGYAIAAAAAAEAQHRLTSANGQSRHACRGGDRAPGMPRRLERTSGSRQTHTTAHRCTFASVCC